MTPEEKAKEMCARLPIGLATWPAVERMIADALRAQIEECAQVAETEHRDWLRVVMGRRIAKEIRALAAK